MPSKKRSSGKLPIKQTKKVVRETKRSVANVGKSVSAIKKAAKKISKKLGVKSPSKNQAQKTFASKSKKTSYTLKELPIPKQKNIAAYTDYIDKHSDELDKLLNKGEYFAATYAGSHTHAVYENIDLLMNQLNKYKGINNGTGKRFSDRELVNQVRIIKFKGSDGGRTRKTRLEYKKLKNEEIAKREAGHQKDLRKARYQRNTATKKVKVKEKEITKLKEKQKMESKKVKAANKRASNAEKQMKLMKSQLAKMKKEIARANKKASKKVSVTKKSGNKKAVVKKAAKKVAPKKQVTKKAAKKTKKR